jgi:hypothetical protein
MGKRNANESAFDCEGGLGVYRAVAAVVSQERGKRWPPFDCSSCPYWGGRGQHAMKPRTSSLLHGNDPANVNDWIRQHGRVLSGNVSFGQGDLDTGRNIDVATVDGFSPTPANTAFSETHTLGRVPRGFIVIRQTLAASFYDGGLPWTSTSISLKCSVASVTFTLLLL